MITSFIYSKCKRYKTANRQRSCDIRS